MKYLMVIAMTKGYSEQTAGAKLCIDLASDWAHEAIADLNIEGNSFTDARWKKPIKIIN